MRTNDAVGTLEHTLLKLEHAEQLINIFHDFWSSEGCDALSRDITNVAAFMARMPMFIATIESSIDILREENKTIDSLIHSLMNAKEAEA